MFIVFPIYHTTNFFFYILTGIFLITWHFLNVAIKGILFYKQGTYIYIYIYYILVFLQIMLN